jgi:hypothetical protein
MIGVSAARGSGQCRCAWLAEVRKGEFFQADRMRLPAWWHRVVYTVLPDEQM